MIRGLPPAPFGIHENRHPQSDVASGHVYIVDGNNRKIACLWGTADEKLALAAVIIAARRATSDLKDSTIASLAIDIGQGPTRQMEIAVNILDLFQTDHPVDLMSALETVMAHMVMRNARCLEEVMRGIEEVAEDMRDAVKKRFGN
jgi:hypothetical protein